MKRCSNCGRMELLSAHSSCDDSTGRISLFPNPYRPSHTVIGHGHTPTQGVPAMLELPGHLPMLLGATLSMWRRGFFASFGMLLMPVAALLAALVLPAVVDERSPSQIGLAGVLFLPLWIAAEAASLVRLSRPAPGEAPHVPALRAWNAAFRCVPKLVWFHAQLLVLMALHAAPALLIFWLWPAATLPAVALGLLGAAWPWARYCLVLPLVLLEGHSVRVAMMRSRAAVGVHAWRVWRLTAVLFVLLVGGVFLSGRSTVLACDVLRIEGLARGLSLLAVVLILPPILFGLLVCARLVLLDALPRVRFAGPPVVLITLGERDSAEALARNLLGQGITAEVIGGTDLGALSLLVTDAHVLVADNDFQAAQAALWTPSTG